MAKNSAPPAVGDGKHYALRHTLGGAPNTPHIVPGVGYVQADPPAPVGGHGEPSLDAAVRAAEDPGCAVELVTLTEAKAAKAREHYAHVRDEGRVALKHASRDKTVPEDRIEDEAGAVTGQEA